VAKFLNKKQKRQLISVILTLLFAGGVWTAQRQGWIQPATMQKNETGSYLVTTFVDGDTLTIDINGNKEQIRLIGVDTPETRDPRVPVQCYGKAASEFTKDLISTNLVRLESDPTNSDRDRYNRLLRYVYLPDNKLVNAEIIKAGYGFAYTLFPFQKLEEFRAYESQARQNNLGLWSSCSINQNGDKRTTSPAL